LTANSDNCNFTGRALRLQEDDLFRERLGGEADDHGYSRRDFFALCRGEEIVSCYRFYKVVAEA
jgi:hypothetical protein